MNSSEAGQGEVRVEARAPSGRSINLTPVPRHGNYVTNFNPTEVGKKTDTSLRTTETGLVVKFCGLKIVKCLKLK